MSDAFSAFRATMFRYVQKMGIDSLAWSFYGTTDGQHGRVRDWDLPLLGCLHYLIRSNGCSRVLESGTGRGVSTACIASAIFHRANFPRITTFDISVLPGRDELWAMLPPEMQSCLDFHRGDSIAGMDKLIREGERFDAALLDSNHDEETVTREFDRAVQLVVPGGLILIHDWLWKPGTVDHALDKFERWGYNVSRLWGAKDAVQEDDSLGLALIVNTPGETRAE